MMGTSASAPRLILCVFLVLAVGAPWADAQSSNGDANSDAQIDPLDWVMLANSFTVMSHPAELVAFLKSLTDPAARDLGHLVPDRVPSGLPVDGG